MLGPVYVGEDMRFAAVLSAVFFMCAPFGAIAETVPTQAQAQLSPLKQVEHAINDLVTVIETSAASTSVEQRREKLRKVIDPVFDFEEMARRSLGTYWKEISAEEQTEFVRVFSDLLARTYLSKIETLKRGMVHLESERIEAPRALVKTIVEDKGNKFPIDYKLLDQNGHWKVYDVIIENIGLVANYRNEFAGVIRKESFAGLMKKLSEK